jgi:pSer/pThr/pTyr-binding forkhead associated (FHA) protein
MNVKLLVQQNGKPAQAFRLRSEETIVGRRRGCDVRIPSDAVSRRHCLVSVREGTVMVEDLASVNGTFVNGKRVDGKQLLYPGDRLEVGPVTFLVEYARADAPAKAPPRTAPKAEDVPELELVEDEDDGAFKLAMDADPKEGPSYDVIAEIDQSGGLQLPENDDLRNLLAQMDDRKPKKKP